MSPPSSESKEAKQETSLKAGGKQSLVWLPPAFTLVSYLAYSSTLKMEATCSSETSEDFQRTTRRYIPEDRTLNGFCLN
jgi:hypothetical protein